MRIRSVRRSRSLPSKTRGSSYPRREGGPSPRARQPCESAQGCTSERHGPRRCAGRCTRAGSRNADPTGCGAVRLPTWRESTPKETSFRSRSASAYAKTQIPAPTTTATAPRTVAASAWLPLPSEPARPSLHAERESKSTKNDWCAEEKRQHFYKPQDAADEADLRGAVARALPGPAAEKGEEGNREHDDERDEEQALAV